MKRSLESHGTVSLQLATPSLCLRCGGVATLRLASFGMPRQCRSANKCLFAASSFFRQHDACAFVSMHLQELDCQRGYFSVVSTVALIRFSDAQCRYLWNVKRHAAAAVFGTVLTGRFIESTPGRSLRPRPHALLSSKTQ